MCHVSCFLILLVTPDNWERDLVKHWPQLNSLQLATITVKICGVFEQPCTLSYMISLIAARNFLILLIIFSDVNASNGLESCKLCLHWVFRN